MMEMKRFESVLRRLISLVLVLSLLLPNFTGVSFAADYDPDEDTICGIPSHAHTEACDEAVTNTVCGKEAGEIHTHIETCYEEKQVQVCTLDEVEAHSHTDECISQQETLACGKEESEGHTHNEACFSQQQMLNCGLEESEIHSHDETCYTTEDVVDCGVEESEGHTHTDACYTLEDVVDCGLEETEGHQHGESCFELRTVTVCGEDDTTPHEHTEACLEVATQRICGLEEHTHDEDCYDMPDIEMYNDVSGMVILSSYTEALTIYNYLYASNADGKGYVMSKDNKFTVTGTASDSITVISGGDASLTDEYTRPMSHDIAIVLDNAEVKGDVTIKPATPNDADGYKTIITVTNASSLSDVELTEGAAVVIDMEADLTLADVTLGANTKLTVNTGGHRLTLGAASGAGDLTITGSGTANVESIYCGTLKVEQATVSSVGNIHANAIVLDGVSVSADGNRITAANAISTVSSSVSNAGLFGFDSSAEGTVTMSFTGGSFTDVTRIGASDDCMAVVRLDAASSVTAEVGVSYAYDYTVSYADVTAKDGWIRNYRVEADSFTGEYSLLTENTALPQYAEDGYTYLGWMTAADAETSIKNINELTAFGDLILYSKTEANMVTVTMDLGFLPNDGNCDNADIWSANYPTDLNTNTGVCTVTQRLGTELALDTPQQFGYIFRGWHVKNSDITIMESTYTIALDELTDPENYKLELEAVWEPAWMHLYWTFSAANMDFENIEISLDGGITWMTPTEMAADNSAYWYMDSLTMKTYDAGRIQYGESLSVYFARLNSDWQYPILRDKRSLSTDQAVIDTAQSFRTWAYDVQPVSGSTTFDTDSNTGLLKKGSGQTWAEYQTSLNTTTISLQPSFGTMNYDLTIPVVSGWSYSVNGTDAVPADGIIKVPNGATVAVKCAYSNRLSISKWAFSVQNGSTLEIAERYTSADTSTIYYEFTMPASNVTAEYNKTITSYINIAKSPITFVEKFVYNGITRSGFWYDARMTAGTSTNYDIPLAGMTPLCYDEDKGYFYIWDFAETFYVTSDGVPTTNQLTLVKTSTVNFKAANLSVRDSYLNNADGRKLYGYSVELTRDSTAAAYNTSVAGKVNAAGSLADMGNIVLVGDGSDPQTFKLNFDGSNIVGAIFSDKYYVASQINNTLNITGKNNGTLMLGTTMANAAMSISSITVNEYTASNSEYLFHASAAGGSISFSTATVNAPWREIYVANNSLSISSTSNVDVETLAIGTSFSIGGSCSVRVRGNVYLGYSNFSIGARSSLVIDGSFLRKYFHWNTNTTAGNSTAVMIVKGNRCELGNTTWTSGTLICNALVFGRCGGVSGGTVIANQIMNAPELNWDIKSGSTEYVQTSGSRIGAANSNGDNYPFQTYSQTESSSDQFKFSGGTVYLLGYYRTNGGSYDVSLTMEETPVWSLVSPMLDANGEYNGTAVSTANALSVVQNSSYSSNECVILGNSTYNTGARSRSIVISGTANIYAAGNLTFFNDTTVSDSAVVWCGGTFGSKNDMTVTGGSITAKEVGIAYDLTTTLSDNTIRWKKIVVSGGSITADRVGTLSKCVSDVSRFIRGAADIDTTCLSNCALEFDAYVNYLLGTTGFTNPEENKEKNSVHISATVTDHVAVYTAAPVTFAPPKFEDEYGTWKLTSVDGPTVDGVGAAANMTNGTEILPETAYDNDRLILLASKENYTMKVVAGAGYVTDLNGQGSVDTAPGKAMNTVTVTLNDAVLAADKTVVWYTDANGYVRRPADYTVTDNVISFTMPYFDVEIYVVPDGMELDLSKHHVTITADGFRTSFDDPDDTTADQEFRYTGSLTITQSLADKTLYRIRTLADVDNINTVRTFTISNVQQADTAAEIGLMLENGAKAHFLIEGSVDLCRVHVDEKSDIVLEGVDTNATANILEIQASITVSNQISTSLGNSSGKTGNITLKNVTLPRRDSGSNFFCYGSTKNTGSKVIYDGCIIKESKWYSDSYLANNVGTVEINNCIFDISMDHSWPNPLFSGVDYVTMNNSSLTYLDNSASSSAAYPFFYGISQKFTINNSAVTATLYHSTATTTYKTRNSISGCAPTVVLSGDSVYTTEERVTYKNIILEDSATLKVGANGTGMLFAGNVEVSDSASIVADTILVSGYYTGTGVKFEEVMANLSGSSPTLKDGTSGGLCIYGGNVTASKVGGDLNSNITVDGGTLTADRIGTLGAIYGYPQETPVAGDNWVCVYEKLPEGISVIVANGTVNVGEYMGGINADVFVTGGTVVLQEDAVLGMTDEQSETLLAYCIANDIDIMAEDNIQVIISGGQVTGEAAGINAPYGDVIVSGETTGVKVENISAQYGTVSISDANSAHTNPLDGQPNVGVYVSDTLTAQNIIITDSARVYAHDAIADAPTHTDVASLTMSDGAVLYTSTYGSAGQGSVSIVGKEGTDIILSARQFAIAYSMRDDATDRATNHEDNKFFFLYDSKGKDAVTLYYPSRHGYDFIGWYETEEKAEAAEAAGAATADELKSIRTDYFGDVHIYGAWKPRQVVFQIQIDGSNIPDLETEMKNLTSGVAQWDAATNLVTFTETVSVSYLSKIFGDGAVDLNDFALPSYVIVDMKIQENGMGLDKTDAAVGKEILALFDSQTDGMLTLTSTYIEKRSRSLTLDLNLDENNRPLGAQFQSNTATKGINTISTYAPIGSSLASAEALLNTNGDLNQPAAPGYSFAGWYTDKDCSGTPVDTTYVITGDNAVYFYADWAASECRVTFDADNGIITTAKTEPQASDIAKTMDAYVVYDTVINGHLSYVSGVMQTNVMPYAWKPGYIFKGWKAEGSNLIFTQESLQELNQTTFAGIDFTKDSVLTFTAVYDPITITYHTEKGSFTDAWLTDSGTVAMMDSKGNITGWKSCTNDSSVSYGGSLAGYTKDPAAADPNSHDIFGQQESGGNTYAVVATTAAAFDVGNKTYHIDDYRSDIIRKGYTFQGWKDAEGNFVGTMPIYSDIEVWAQWSANTYYVTLREGRSDHSTLVPDPEEPQAVTLKVGEEIAAGASGVEISNWPDRNDWYAYTKYKDTIAENDYRYILGFTFDPLEPGAPGVQNTDHQMAYYVYANSVVTLINNDALFVKESRGDSGVTEGTEFHLPERSEYSADVINGTNEVPDYPEGSSFNMYAIYRERSLVFIERYVDTATGEVVEEVLQAPPYYEYSDYPDAYKLSQRKADIEEKGYTLTKWSVNDYTTGDAYPTEETDRETIYQSKIEGWITAAEKKGSFDVNIYTVYSAQVTDTLTIEAATQPSAVSADPVEWPVPESMQLGTAVFTVSNIPEGLDLVSLAELETNRYNSASTGDVALCLELVNSAGEVKETHWLTTESQGAEITVNSTISVGAGWKIRVTLYHSRVIAEAESCSFDMTVTFPTVLNQKITFDPVSVELKPTLWTVQYNVELPEDEYLVIEDRKGFSSSGSVRSQVVTNWIYGSELMAENLLPALEGYKGAGTWSFDGDTFAYGANGTLALTDSHTNSALKLTTKYVPENYTLANSAGAACAVSRTGTIPYHTSITVMPQDTDASFIWLKFADGEYRLDRLLETGYAEEFHASVADGVYTIMMPAGNVEIVYDDIMDLYLDNGTIDLTADTYTQNGKTVNWNGNYRIWQDESNNFDFHSTENVLNINGDLTVWGDGSGTTRTIELGRLNITYADSVALKPGCGAVMVATGEISAKNILVPEHANLSLESSSTTKLNLKLVPDIGYAAIGGHNAAGGTISLNTLAMDLTMPAGSVASGIGAGSETGGAASVVVNNCTVNVAELATVADGAYRGTWFGGKNTGSVVIDKTTITIQTDGNGAVTNAGTMTDGNTVKIIDSDFGTASGYIQNHKLRGENIWVDNSRLYINANETVLCPGNTLNVDYTKAGTVIDVIGYADTLYLNTLKIHNAAADVMVFNTQLADLSNGDITITATGLTQNNQPHEHTGGYRLLNSVDADASADLTVDGLATNMYITTEGSCNLGTLTAYADTRLRPLGVLPVKNVAVSRDTLTVEADDTAGLSVISGLGGAGNYTQNGGLLMLTADAVMGGDMTLSSVTVSASGHDLGSIGAERVTTVTIENSTITADHIGAVGQQNESFTFVALDADSTLNGTLVQDHYRLKYMLEDQNFSYDASGVPVAEGTDSALPTVLRSTCSYTSGTAGTVIYLPGIPDAPKYTGEDESYFSNWYIQAQNNSRIALSQTEVEGFDANETLADEHMSYVIDTAANDGTKTLQLYAWMKITATGIITNTRELNKMSGTAVTANIETDGAWTAQYTVDGVVLKDASYAFTFETALPANTKLTLRFQNGDTLPVFYYCILRNSTNQVSESDFYRMGTAQTADLLSNENMGQRFQHTIQISADFEDVDAVTCVSGLSMIAEGAEYPLASVKNTASIVPLSGSVKAGASEVTVTAAPGSDQRYVNDHLYLVARIKKNGAEISLPYDAKLLWDGKEGTWFGGNMVYFDLGVCAALNKTASWETSGLENGTYSIEWSLTRGDAGTQNVYGSRLAVSNSPQLIINVAEPYLKVTPDSSEQVLDVGTAHAIDFTFDTKASGFYASLEKQNGFQIFQPQSGYPLEVSGESLQIILPDEAGVYRIRFSLDAMYGSGSQWDDVYFTFILK